MKIWADDLRPVPDGFVGAKSVNEAIKIIEKAEANNIEIECLDLDYDLEEYASDGGDAFKVSLFVCAPWARSNG